MDHGCADANNSKSDQPPVSTLQPHQCILEWPRKYRHEDAASDRGRHHRLQPTVQRTITAPAMTTTTTGTTKRWRETIQSWTRTCHGLDDIAHLVHALGAKQIDMVCVSISVHLSSSILRVSWSVDYVWRSAKCGTLCMMQRVGFIPRDRMFCVCGDGVKGKERRRAKAGLLLVFMVKPLGFAKLAQK